MKDAHYVARRVREARTTNGEPRRDETRHLECLGAMEATSFARQAEPHSSSRESESIFEASLLFLVMRRGSASTHAEALSPASCTCSVLMLSDAAARRDFEIVAHRTHCAEPEREKDRESDNVARSLSQLSPRLAASRYPKQSIAVKCASSLISQPRLTR